MDYKRLIQTMRQASKIYGLTIKETGLILGVPKYRVSRWHRNDVNISLKDYVAWADLMGYELTIKRKIQ